MTISLTVILIECTNEITLALPIMVTLMVNTIRHNLLLLILSVIEITLIIAGGKMGWRHIQSWTV